MENDLKLESASQEISDWAKILRDEGVGKLYGKFKNDWTFTNNQNVQEMVTDREGVFIGGGVFGKEDLMLTVSSSMRDLVNAYAQPIRYTDSKEILDQLRKEDKIHNSLIIDRVSKASSKEKYDDWILFNYVSELTCIDVDRGGGINLLFQFALPPIRAKNLILKINQDPNFVENLFQKMYPGLTQKGKAERIKTDKLFLVDAVGHKAEQMLRFSNVVGEADSY
jgi:hypothetical protein